MTTSTPRGVTSAVRAVFLPATWLLNRLRYAPKFVLIGLLFMIPFGYVSYLQFRGVSDDIEFNRLERDGVAYVTPTISYLYAIQRHQLFATAAATGDAQSVAKADEAAADAARWEQEVDVADARLGGELGTSGQWATAKSAWALARDGQFATPAERDRAHNAATAAIADLIVNYAGNNSKLILDPDLDSYWLMDGLLIKLPLLGNNVAKASTVAMLSTAGALDPQLEIAGLNKLVEVTTSDLKAVNLATAIRETKNFGRSRTLARLADPMEQVSLAIAAHRQATLQEYVGANPTRSSQQVNAAAATSLAELHSMASSIAPELDALVAQRLDGYLGDRRNALIAVTIASLLLLYLFTGFFFAVRDSVGAIGDATRRMIAGTTETFSLATRDELGQVAADYNQINAALNESRTLQARVQRDNDDLQQNIMQMLIAVSDASEGNLTVRAPITAGALGNVADAFNQLMEALQSLIGDVQRQVTQTRSAVEQINRASQQMASGASQQVSEIGQATQLAQQMASKMTDVTRDASTAAEAARNTEASAVAGQKSVDEVVGGMESLRQNVQAGAKKMKGLGDRSMEITSIVSTINRISEQTNMLALNAAIEAARAGEHGRGFSVVAEEVRKLAERTATATNEIEKLVKAIHVETNETVNAIEQQTQVVEQEAQMVGSAGASLRKIREVSTRSAELVATITAVANTEAERTKQVVSSMSQISAIASATQDGAKTTLDTAGQLLVLSSKLSDAVARFRVTA